MFLSQGGEVGLVSQGGRKKRAWGKGHCQREGKRGNILDSTHQKEGEKVSS